MKQKASFVEPVTPRVLTISQALVLLPGLGRTRLYEEIAAGRLVTAKFGRRRVIPLAALDAWLADRIAEGPGNVEKVTA